MLSGICDINEEDFKRQLKQKKDQANPRFEHHRNGMPASESIFDKKSLFKNFGSMMKVPLPLCMTQQSAKNSEASNASQKAANKK